MGSTLAAIRLSRRDDADNVTVFALAMDDYQRT